MLEIKGKYLTQEVVCCPLCGEPAKNLSDSGTDKNGLTRIDCHECCGRFFLITGERTDPTKNLSFFHGGGSGGGYVWTICPDCGAGRWINKYDLKRAKHKGRCQSSSQPALKGG